MKTFAFTDSDRIVVVKKSQGEMTVTIKLKDADKDSQKKINFMPCRLVSVLLYSVHSLYRTTTIIVISIIFLLLHPFLLLCPYYYYLRV